MKNWVKLLLLLAVGLPAMGQSNTVATPDSTNIPDSSNVIQFNLDDPFLEALDSLHGLKVFELFAFTDDIKELNVHDYPLDSIPIWSDSILDLRLKALDATTPIGLDFNDDTHRLIRVYGNHRRLMMSRVLGLSELYFPLFEEELEKEGLPIELKYLPIVESALNNTVRSRAGAVGMWQFMYRTGKYLGLEINSYVDERRDPIKSTQTAVKYLKYLNGLYDNWHLALAAYNAGPGNVNKAIRRAGGSKNFWKIQKYLPKETRNYVPSFIAVTYLMNHAADHNLYPVKPKFFIRHTDTVHVKQSIGFGQIAEVLCMDKEDLVFLNPMYKRGHIPVKQGGAMTLVLPAQLVGDFINNEQNIYNYKPDDKEEVEIDIYANRKELKHRVRKGESVGLIAQRYKVKASEIREWNNLTRRSLIYPGQKLTIYSKSAKRAEYKKEETYNGYVYYTIRRGDTLWDIAKKYKGVTAKDIMELNRFNSRKVLKPGMKIKIKST